MDNSLIQLLALCHMSAMKIFIPQFSSMCCWQFQRETECLANNVHYYTSMGHGSDSNIPNSYVTIKTSVEYVHIELEHDHGSKFSITSASSLIKHFVTVGVPVQPP